MKTPIALPILLASTAAIALCSCDSSSPTSDNSAPEAEATTPPLSAPAAPGDPALLIAAAKELIANNDGVGVRGVQDGWWFLRNELKHVQHGAFWDVDYASYGPEGSAGTDDAFVDPVPVIAKYAEELKTLGIDLLLVPVPPKATIYPEALAAGAGQTFAAPFIAKLDAAGVEVLDLEPLFMAAKAGGGAPLYCAQDSHWSPRACQITAAEIAKRYGSADWIAAAAQDGIAVGSETTLDVHGDLLDDAAKASDPKETLNIRYAGTGGGDTPSPAKPNSNSPIVVMGDSHTLVFSEGAASGMHASGAGLIDHITAEFGIPVDLQGSRGGGGMQARVGMARRANGDAEMWGTKKLVIWVFSTREFTQERWKEIPAQP